MHDVHFHKKKVMRKYILYLYTDQDKIPHKYLTFAWNDPVAAAATSAAYGAAADVAATHGVFAVAL